MASAEASGALPPLAGPQRSALEGFLERLAGEEGLAGATGKAGEGSEGFEDFGELERRRQGEAGRLGVPTERPCNSQPAAPLDFASRL